MSQGKEQPRIRGYFLIGNPIKMIVEGLEMIINDNESKGLNDVSTETGINEANSTEDEPCPYEERKDSTDVMLIKIAEMGAIKGLQFQDQKVQAGIDRLNQYYFDHCFEYTNEPFVDYLKIICTDPNCKRIIDSKGETGTTRFVLKAAKYYRHSQGKKIGARIVELLKKHIFLSMIVSGIVGAIIGWCLSWVLPSKPVIAKNIPQKELTCILDYSQKLVTKNTKDDMLKIYYSDKEVIDPYITSITILNSGDYEIDNEDFKKEFSIDFPDCGRIVNAQVMKWSNHDVLDEVLSKSAFNGTEFVISDLFLNPGESFTISIITENKPSKITYSPRISGISNLTLVNTTADRIEKLKTQRNTFSIVMIVVLSIIVIGISVFLIVTIKGFKRIENRMIK